MKKLSILLIAILFCSLQGHAQFWISFGWNEPHCQNCLWMEQAIRMTNRQAAEYHKIIHRYGEKIEREARKHYRYWDQSARKIYKLRMERDRKLQRILSPSQFRLYVRFVREAPTRIHDWRGWYNNPHYPHYRPSNACYRYEDHYWHCQWNIRTIDGLTVSTTANGIPVNMIVLNHIITMAVHIMTMGSGSPANTIVRAIREAVPVPIITRISTIRTNLTRNVRIGIKTGITIGTNGLTRIARIAANVRVTGGA